MSPMKVHILTNHTQVYSNPPFRSSTYEAMHESLSFRYNIVHHIESSKCLRYLIEERILNPSMAPVSD